MTKSSLITSRHSPAIVKDRKSFIPCQVLFMLDAENLYLSDNTDACKANAHNNNSVSLVIIIN